MLNDALDDLRAGLTSAFSGRELRASFSWQIGGRAVSEIGGRVIEDFVLSHIADALSRLKPRNFDTVAVDVPATGRAMEDFSVRWRRGGSEFVLLVDIKGHNEYRRGSRPNLASIRKCIALYTDPACANHELVIFFCRYRPTVKPAERSHDLSYQILPESFGRDGVFLFRHLSKSNLDPANIGSGGQLLLAREDRISLEDRSREQFVSLLQELRVRATGPGSRLPVVGMGRSRG